MKYDITITLKPSVYFPEKEIDYTADIIKWIIEHDAYDMNPIEVARAMVLEAIENTKFNEDVYPYLKDKLCNAVEECYERMLDE